MSLYHQETGMHLSRGRFIPGFKERGTKLGRVQKIPPASAVSPVVSFSSNQYAKVAHFVAHQVSPALGPYSISTKLLKKNITKDIKE